MIICSRGGSLKLLKIPGSACVKEITGICGKTVRHSYFIEVAGRKRTILPFFLFTYFYRVCGKPPFAVQAMIQPALPKEQKWRKYQQTN
jgi:hypothetical protein